MPQAWPGEAPQCSEHVVCDRPSTGRGDQPSCSKMREPPSAKLQVGVQVRVCVAAFVISLPLDGSV